MKYLITNPDSFGDILLRQPLFTGLIEAGHEVGVVVRKSYSSIIHFLDPRIRIFSIEDINPYVPTILDQKESIHRSLNDAVAYDPDFVVIAPFQRTLIDLWTLERFPGKNTIGIKGIEVVFENGERVFRETRNPGDRTLFVPEDLREVEKNRRLLGLCLGKEVSDYTPKLSVDDTTLELSRSTLSQLALSENEFIICTPGSTSVAVKQYPTERFIDILEYWSKKYQRQILLVGNRVETAVLETIREGLITKGMHPVIWIGDEMNLEILLGLISLSRVYFGNDTGPMHFAAGLGKPVIALFGGGTWPRFIPLASRGSAILQDLPCYGCGWRCVFDKAHCIHEVREDWVKEAIDEFETKPRKKFTIRTHDFKGEVMDHWIAEAKDQLRNNKLKLDSMSFELEKARELARNREQASAEGRVELEAMRTEYLNLKRREDEALTQAASLREEITTLRGDVTVLRGDATELRKANALFAETIKMEQEGRQGVEAQMRDLMQQLERERDANRQLRENESALKLRMASREKTIGDLETAVKNGKEKIGQRESTLAADKLTIQELNSQVASGKQTISRLGDELTKERDLAGQLRSTLATAKKIGAEMRSVLIDFKPRLEEFHLSLRLQDLTLQAFEQRLQGVAQSGWTKLGLALHIPWLSKWYAESFDASKGGAVPVVRKDEFEVPLSVKEHMRTELNRILGMMESFPA